MLPLSASAPERFPGERSPAQARAPARTHSISRQNFHSGTAEPPPTQKQTASLQISPQRALDPHQTNSLLLAERLLARIRFPTLASFPEHRLRQSLVELQFPFAPRLLQRSPDVGTVHYRSPSVRSAQHTPHVRPYLVPSDHASELSSGRPPREHRDPIRSPYPTFSRARPGTPLRRLNLIGGRDLVPIIKSCEPCPPECYSNSAHIAPLIVTPPLPSSTGVASPDDMLSSLAREFAGPSR